MSWRNKVVSVAASFTLGGAALFPALPVLAAPALAAPAPVAQGARAGPKALSGTVDKALTWLASRQLPNGAWGQGDEAVGMGGGASLAAVGNVADTGMATLALLRSGSSPASGPHAARVEKAVGFIVSEIEASDQDSLYITQIRGTRVQGKIGPYIDTFVAATVLAELKNKMPDSASDARVTRALAKVIAKIQKNQRGDGSFDASGWAPVLSQGMAAKGINRAAQAGLPVDKDVLARAEGYAKGGYDATSRGFAAGGSAGVGLYSAAATAGAMQDSVNTNESREQYMRRKATEGATAGEKADARKEVERFAEAKRANEVVNGALIARLDDPGFVSGFGSNGGEEFLSYMMVSESLAVKGGTQWEKWDAQMAQNLGRVQNGDGSWTGHHCITGRTFCTAAALLVLMADRAPIPSVQATAAG